MKRQCQLFLFTRLSCIGFGSKNSLLSDFYQEEKNLKKILAILLFALLGCGSVVLAGQNTNSSTTMEPNHNMSGRRMGGMRHRHKKHRRHRHMKMKMKMKMGNMNANTQ